MIHPLSDCLSTSIGKNTNVWQYVVILSKAVIGDNCNICAHSFIENDVKIGNGVTVKCGVYLWDGITIEDNVTFTNDKYPRAKTEFKLQRTLIKKNASIGAASTILGGLTIGENAMVGAGSLVTKDIPDNELWLGSPAKFIRKLEK
jgi:acetyltransferase-like isoleucine patch superfamily enzyme